VDWVQAVGFQREVLHTGAVRHLLRGPRGRDVARALTGDELIGEITGTQVEARLVRGGRRPVDLAATVTTTNGTPGAIGIEVKVDSAWSGHQLRETVPADARGVLLAVGHTHLAVTENDMCHLDDDYEHRWRCIGPRQLAEIVEPHADGDAELAGYARHLRREADEHEAARAAIRAGQPVTSARDAQALGHWAYFGEVLAMRKDAYGWDRKTPISGPLVTWWLPGHTDGTGDYLEFMGEGDRRSLCIKTHAPRWLLHLALACTRTRAPRRAAGGCPHRDQGAVDHRQDVHGRPRRAA
jgi:hypothetical protein